MKGLFCRENSKIIDIITSVVSPNSSRINYFDMWLFLIQVSITSEQDNSFTLPQDDNSNDALVIVDDDSNWSMNDSNSGR